MVPYISRSVRKVFSALQTLFLTHITKRITWGSKQKHLVSHAPTTVTAVWTIDHPARMSDGCGRREGWYRADLQYPILAMPPGRMQCIYREKSQKTIVHQPVIIRFLKLIMHLFLSTCSRSAKSLFLVDNWFMNKFYRPVIQEINSLFISIHHSLDRFSFPDTLPFFSTCGSFIEGWTMWVPLYVFARYSRKSG